MKPPGPVPQSFRVLILALLAAGLAFQAEAEVQVKVLADGTKLVYNENETQRKRRTAGRLLSVPSSELQFLIDRHAQRQGLSPRLVQAVVQVESGYNPKALSQKGAMGLMQLMPATARELDVTHPYNSDQNIRGGTTYLRQMLQRYAGDLRLALAAYNAGPTAVDKYQDVPPYRETRNYVRKVLSLYHQGSHSPYPSPLLRDHARDLSMKRARAQDRLASEGQGGDPVIITRDKTGRIVVSTAPKPN